MTSGYKRKTVDKIYICGDTPCPADPTFEHRFYYGCVPRDFNERSGRSKTNRQARVSRPDLPGGYRYEWDGGCDDAAATERKRNATRTP